MPLIFNLRHLDKGDLHLQGELTAEELELTDVDELVRLAEPIKYELVAELLPDSVLVQGQLRSNLACQCARCLRPFTQKLELPDWICNLPLEGEDKVTVSNDCVDLTSYIREDTLLAFPQHPLCEPGCRGLLGRDHDSHKAAGMEEQANQTSSAWTELNKLKF